MLLSDGVYKKVPLFWTLAGVLFLFLGLGGGPELRLFYAYIAVGLLCIARGIWIYQARWKFHKRNQVRLARDTMVIRHPISDEQKEP